MRTVHVYSKIDLIIKQSTHRYIEALPPSISNLLLLSIITQYVFCLPLHGPIKIIYLATMYLFPKLRQDGLMLYGGGGG